jgi:hypothetical protein
VASYRNDELNVRLFCFTFEEMKRTLLLLLLSYAAWGQKKDTTYAYDVCIHTGDKGSFKGHHKTKYLSSESSSTISGKIVDSQKNKIKNAAVALYFGIKDSIVGKLYLGETNTFNFSKLKLGTYKLKVTCEGFMSSQIENITISKPLETDILVYLSKGTFDRIVGIISKKKLNKMQLNRKIKALEKEYNN